MVLEVLKTSDIKNNSNSDVLSNTINDASISEMILLDENMQPLVTESFIEENYICISSTLLGPPKNVEGKLKLIYIYFMAESTCLNILIDL